MIDRDNVRYTDDVIATLQSVKPIWYIANALNISVDDVMYHHGEVHGMAHKGSILPLRATKTAESTECMPTPTPLPHDAEYFATHTAAQVGAEYSQDVHNVRKWCRRWGYTLMRSIRPIRPYRKSNDWPTDPEWYASRTSIEIAKELGYEKRYVQKYLAMHKTRWLYLYNYIEWPEDREYYETRTAPEISEALKVKANTVRAHCKLMGYTLKKMRKFIDWPSDPQWYAERTRHAIATELGIKYVAVVQYVIRNRLVCKVDKT